MLVVFVVGWTASFERISAFVSVTRPIGFFAAVWADFFGAEGFFGGIWTQFVSGIDSVFQVTVFLDSISRTPQKALCTSEENEH